MAVQLEGLLAGVKYDPALVQGGLGLYVSHCVLCHGVPGVDRGGNIPNLGYVKPEIITELDKFVFKGPYLKDGMPDFSDRLKPPGSREAEGIHPGHRGLDPPQEVIACAALDRCGRCRRCRR